MNHRSQLWGIAFVAPAMIWVGGVIFFPLWDSIRTSFHQLGPDGWTFVGITNFAAVLDDPLFWTSLARTFLFDVASVLFHAAIGLALALVLRRVAGQQLFRGLALVPWALPGVIVSIMWLWIYQPQYGLLNGLLIRLGLEEWTRAWTGEAGFSLAAVILANIWRGIPFAMVMFLAGLHTIPQSLYDAGRVDGAGRWTSLWHITLPLLRGAMLTVTLLDFVWTFAHFELVWLMTGGGPIDSSHVLGTLIYQSTFRYLEFGRGAAEAVLLMFFVAASSLAYFWVSRRLAPEVVQ